jgi:hypothetical protein
MRSWLFVLIAACGGSTGQSPTPAIEPAMAVAPAPQPAEDDAVDADGCFAGASLQGTPPPEGRKVWCAKPDETRHGLYTLWFASGDRGLQGSYKAGKLHGTWTRWYETGGKQSEAAYRNGRMHGPFTRWYENGSKMTDGQYVDGNEDGTWTYWRPDGAPEKEEHWKMGELQEPTLDTDRTRPDTTP